MNLKRNIIPVFLIFIALNPLVTRAQVVEPAKVPVEVLTSPNPLARKPVTSAVLIDLERRLGPNRWLPGRYCRLEAQKRFVDRKFLSGSYRGDAIFINFETDHLGPRSQQATITERSTWGARLTTDPQAGPVEDIRVELNDLDGTWVQFRHTGTHLVTFEIGNTRGVTLCLVRD